MDPLMSFGGDDKQYIGTGPNVLGWGMAAAFGVKLARPDQPVVSVVGDGSFCFSGPQPLWTPGALQGAGHQHRAQQPQLQQRAQSHLALSAARSSRPAAT